MNDIVTRTSIWSQEKLFVRDRHLELEDKEVNVQSSQ